MKIVNQQQMYGDGYSKALLFPVSVVEVIELALSVCICVSDPLYVNALLAELFDVWTQNFVWGYS